MGTSRGIVAHELLVDLQNAFQLLVQDLAVDVGEVEIDHGLAVDAQPVLIDHLENGAGGDVARHQIAVLGIPLFQEVPALLLRDRARFALVAGLPRHPHASALAARRFRHQPQLVFARNRGRVHLDEFAVGVVRALLIERRLRRSGADHGIGGLAEDGPDAAGADDHRVGGEGVHFHRPQVLGADAAADAIAIEHGGEELPVLVLGDLAFSLVAAHLLVERVEQLLAGGGAGEGGAVEERAAEAAEIEHAFRSAVEGDAHAVEQVDDAGRGLAHIFHRRLVGEEVAAVDRCRRSASRWSRPRPSGSWRR